MRRLRTRQCLGSCLPKVRVSGAVECHAHGRSKSSLVAHGHDPPIAAAIQDLSRAAGISAYNREAVSHRFDHDIAEALEVR